MKRHHVFCLIVLMLVFTFPARPQTGQILVRVVNVNHDGIAEAKVALVRSGGTSYSSTGTTSADGQCVLSIDWQQINEANSHGGGAWKITAAREGYASNEMNIRLSNGTVEPVEPMIVLSADVDKNLISQLDGCLGGSGATRRLYLFDLQTSLAGPEASQFMVALHNVLKRAINEHLRSFRLIDDNDLDIKRCPQTVVNDEDRALLSCQRLRAPGVMWGFVNKQTSGLSSSMTFTTALGNKPIHEFSDVSYKFKQSISEIVRANVDVSYLAFASYVQGKLYLADGKKNEALKCFNHVKSLKAQLPEIQSDASRLIDSLKQASQAISLRPLEGGQ